MSPLSETYPVEFANLINPEWLWPPFVGSICSRARRLTVEKPNTGHEIAALTAPLCNCGAEVGAPLVGASTRFRAGTTKL
jgi:hypothetical protein